MATSDYTPDTPSEQIEEWRDIPGYEGWYQASTLGNIRRMRPMGNGGQRPSLGVLKKNYAGKNGYVTNVLTREGIERSFAVHSLVMLTFVGARPESYDINHINGIRTDNRLVNLEYVTRKENMKHARDVLNHSTEGIRNGQAKLTEDDVRGIRELRRGGMPIAEIAIQYKVAISRVSQIVNRKSWKHVSDG